MPGRLIAHLFRSKDHRADVGGQGTYVAWTAISKPPYLTALALWPKGDCWHGGGVFETARRVWLNHKPEVAIPHRRHRPKGLEIISNPEARGEDWPVWSKRMILDGWTLVQSGRFVMRRGNWVTECVEIWHRPHATEKLVLIRTTHAMSARRAGGYVESFRVATPSRTLPLPDVNWADWDQNGRLVFTRAGKLFTANIEPAGVSESELADFTDQQPAEVPTPAWACSWDRHRLGDR